MKKFTSFLAIVLTISLFHSCVLEQNIHFNEDLSGQYSMKLDMSAFMAMAGDSTVNDSTQLTAEDFKQVEDNIRQVSGITNVQSTTVDGVYQLSYGFKDPGSLNEAGSQTGEGSGGVLQFSKKGKKLIVEMKPLDGADEEMSAEDLESMEGMFTFQYNLTFDKKISKIKSKVATLNKETNTVTYEFGLKEYFDKDTDWKTEITLK